MSDYFPKWFVVLISSIFLISCGQGSGPGPAETTPVHISMRIPEAGARSSFKGTGTRFHAASPHAVASVEVGARDAAGAPLAFASVSVTPGQEVTLRLSVPAGPARIFSAKAFDGEGGFLYQGESTPVDLVVNIPASVAIRMVAASTSLKLTLLGDGPNGKEPASNIRVILHDPNSGAVLRNASTDIGGVADFGEIGAARMSLSIIGEPSQSGNSPGAVPAKRMTTLLNIPPGEYILNDPTRFQNSNRSPLATLNLTLTDLPSGSAGAFLDAGSADGQAASAVESEANFPAVTVHQLQPDGTFSLLGQAFDSNNILLGCGPLLDQLPAELDDRRVRVAAGTPPVQIPFTASGPVAPLIGIVRKGRMFNGGFFGDRVSSAAGSLRYCEMAGADGFSFFAAEPHLASMPSSKFLGLFFPSLPPSVHFAMPDLSIDSLSRSADGRTITWSPSGADLGKIDFSAVGLRWDGENVDYEWDLIGAHSPAGVRLPDLPEDLAERIPPAAGVGLTVRLGGLDTIDGFESFIEKLTDLTLRNTLFSLFGANEFIEVSATGDGTTGPALTSITVTPQNPTLDLQQPLQLTATGHYSDGSSRALSTGITWSSGNQSVATVDADGLARGVGIGAATISAAAGDVGGSTDLQVVHPRFDLTVSRSGDGTGTVTSSPAGIICGADCTEPYDAGTEVTLTAAPVSDSDFIGWGGACSGTAACNVTMDAAKSVTATFTLKAFTLNVSKTGSGTGTVTSAPGGIHCGTDCSESYTINSSVTLTATPSSGSNLTLWSGCDSVTGTSCSVNMTSAKSVTATFSARTFVLSVKPAGNGRGTVTSDLFGISCGSTCSASFVAGTTVRLTPAPDSGSVFAAWDGACTGSGVCTVKMNGDQSIVATFNVQDFSIVSSGRTTLKGTATFDLETGVQGGVSETADIWWEQIDDVARRMVPQNNSGIVNLGVVDFPAITPQDLQRLKYSAEPIVGNNDQSNQLIKGDVFAVLTRAGNYAKVRVLTYGRDLDIEWITYKPVSP